MKAKITLITALAAAFSCGQFAALAEELPTTAEEQKALTPDAVLKELMDGNKRFQAGKLSDPNVVKSIEAASTGQFPKAVILSCLDSRVPVEQVFDQGIGDIFVGRVAGNIENGDQLGSMEFGTKVAGAKLIMVLGHEACGAVKGACDGVELGNITGLLANIQPAVDAVKGIPEDKRNSKNPDFVEKLAAEHVRLTVADIRKRSELLSKMEEAGEIKIVGAVYSLKDGSVTLLD